MPPFMSPNAPEFVPTSDDLLYGHLMQVDPYAQQQMPMALYPGGRPPATPHSDRQLAEMNLQKPTLDQRAFAAVRAMDHDASMVPPPPQHEPLEPQWSPLPSESSAPPAVPVLPSPAVAGLPGDAAAGFAIARGFGVVDAERQHTPVVSRPPPGLEDEAANIMADKALSGHIENQPVMKHMAIQTEGPACNACGAAFGCAGKCPWSRNQLLGLREAFLRTKVDPKDSGALKAARHQEASITRQMQVGGA